MSQPPPSAIHLTLLRHGDTITVDLAETGTLIPRSETQVDDAFLLRTCAKTPLADACRELVEDPEADPASYAEDLARLPYRYRIHGGPELRAAARALAERVLAAVD